MIGQVGPYRLLEVLGRGGQAVVFRAQGPDGRVVALKRLTTPSALAAARLSREARLLASLGPGFVPLLDHGFGVGPDGQARPYLVMPLMEGGPLDARLARGGALTPAEGAALGVALADALSRAHARGAVHRDLKPSNVLFDGEGRPHLADLGLGVDALARDDPGRLTRTHEVGGTPGYLAPEQMAGLREVGPPADLFGLGTVLYEALAGRPAFGGDGPVQRMAIAAQGQAPPLRATCPAVPPWLADAVHACLAVDPAARPTAAGLARLLRRGQARGFGRGHRRAAVAVAAFAVGLAGVLLLVTRGDVTVAPRAPAATEAAPATDGSPSTEAVTARPTTEGELGTQAAPVTTTRAASDGEDPGLAFRPGRSSARLEGARLVTGWTPGGGERTIAELAIVVDPVTPALATPAGGGIELLALEDGRLLERLPPSRPAVPVLALAASPDGRLLAAADARNRLRRWSRPPGGRWREEPAPDVPAMVLAYAGTTLQAVAGDGTLRPVEADGRILATWRLPEPPSWLGASAGVRVFASRSGKVVRSAVAGTGTPRTLEHPGDLRGLALAPDGSASLSIDRAGALRRWAPQTGEVLTAEAFPLDPGPPRGVVWSGDGGWAAAVFDGGVAVLEGGQAGLRAWDVPGVTAAAIASGVVVVGQAEGGLQAFDLRGGGASRTWTRAAPPSTRLVAIAWPRADLAWLVDASGRTRTIDPAGASRPVLRGRAGSAPVAAYSPAEPDGGLVVLDAGGSLWRWAPLEERPRALDLAGLSAPLVGGVGWGPLAIGLGSDGGVTCWDLHGVDDPGRASPSPAPSSLRHAGCRAIAPLDRPGALQLVLAGDDGWLVLVEPDGSGQRIGRHEAAVTAVVGCRGGVVSGDAAGAVRLWRGGADGRPVPVAIGSHALAVTALVVSPDQSLVASLSRDGSLAVWCPPGPGARAVVDLEPTLDAATCAAFSPDGRSLLVGTRRGRVYLVEVQ